MRAVAFGARGTLLDLEPLRERLGARRSRRGSSGYEREWPFPVAEPARASTLPEAVALALGGHA